MDIEGYRDEVKLTSSSIQTLTKDRTAPCTCTCNPPTTTTTSQIPPTHLLRRIRNPVHSGEIVLAQRANLVQHLSLPLALLEAQPVPYRRRQQGDGKWLVEFRREDLVCR